jgi:hypothetical protein
MNKNIILALCLVSMLSTSVKANFLPAETILQIRNDSIENKYINNECKTKREKNGFSYDCKNGLGGFVSLDVACNNYQIDHRLLINVEYNFRCQNYKKNIHTTENTYNSNFMINNKIMHEKEKRRITNNYVSAYK